MRFDLLGLTVACDRPLPGAVAPPSSILDVRVEEAIGSPARPARWVGENDWPRIALDSRTATLRFDEDAVFVLDPDARAIRYHLLCELDDATFGHELVDHVLPRYVSMLGRYVIHGSAVAGGAGAVVFVGPSGAGKSTLAAAMASAGRRVLADDAAVLTQVDGIDHVVPSGTSLRLYDDAATAVLDPAAVIGPAMAYWSTKRLVAPAELPTPPAGRAPAPLRAVVELGPFESEEGHSGAPAEGDATDGDSVLPALQLLDGGESFELLARNSFDLPDDSPTAGITVLDRWAPLAGRIHVSRLRRRRSLEELADVVALLAPLLDGDE